MGLDNTFDVVGRGGALVSTADEDLAWAVIVEATDPASRQVDEALLALANGRIGVRGVLEEDGEHVRGALLAGGVFEHRDGEVDLLEIPAPTAFDIEPSPLVAGRRVLDLRTGVLTREAPVAGGRLRSTRFVSLDRPELVIQRVEGPEGTLASGSVFTGPPGPVRDGQGDRAFVSVGGQPGGAVVAVRDFASIDDGVKTIDRLAAVVTDPQDVPDPASAWAAVADAESAGFDRLLADHRAAWAACWEDATVAVSDVPDLQRAIRFAVFHLLACAAPGGESTVGARGLTGSDYRGHVFWDTGVFVLPAVVATRPAAARSILEYRVRRLDAARARARATGHEGARFPWESADDGSEVTPTEVWDGHEAVPIRTGELEEHIVADVAWSAWHYVEWTGDEAFLAGPGRDLVVETARYWASRIEVDADGSAHLRRVIGPDEYHEEVDDNAYTNVMARWNLRLGADLTEDGDGDQEEAAPWRDLADRLVDGYDPRTGIYEQFAGYHRLEPVVMDAEPSFGNKLHLGLEELGRTQAVKQADVLMLHHILPEEVAPGSLAPNLDQYLPRTRHGSSLSPAVHASLLARAGRQAHAEEWFGLAARLDLGRLIDSTAGGLHLATMGGVWQALAFGFLGLRSTGGVLHVAPAVPARWGELRLRLRYRGSRLAVAAGEEHLEVDADGPVTIVVGARAPEVVEGRSRFERGRDGWERMS